MSNGEVISVIKPNDYIFDKMIFLGSTRKLPPETRKLHNNPPNRNIKRFPKPKHLLKNVPWTLEEAQAVVGFFLECKNETLIGKAKYVYSKMRNTEFKLRSPHAYAKAIYKKQLLYQVKSKVLVNLQYEQLKNTEL